MAFSELFKIVEQLLTLETRTKEMATSFDRLNSDLVTSFDRISSRLDDLLERVAKIEVEQDRLRETVRAEVLEDILGIMSRSSSSRLMPPPGSGRVVATDEQE